LSPIEVGIAFLGVAVLWFLKQVFAAILGQQVKGTIPDYTARRARAAAEKLPPDLSAEYEDEWLAELTILSGKPLSALKYAYGLSRAAAEIAAVAGAPSSAGWFSDVSSRGRDLASSAMLLLLFAPLLLAIAGLSRLMDGHRPILSRRLEPGKDGKPFVRLRFTTVKRLPDGPFVRTRLGWFLIRFSLDELPALINVLRGDLSLIGPPAGYKALDPDSLFDLKVRPGLLSWQLLTVEGFITMPAGEARHRDEHRTLRWDIALIWNSMRALLRHE
jgi:lipopolysaccharide/colanic/teichoic acid biosynthesis glycosyltransferase